MYHLMHVENKIVSGTQLLPLLALWRFKNEKIVFTNGCFDILHRGHIDYLSRAADLGTKFIVGLNDDDSVRRQNKGASRPLQDQRSRALVLASLSMVDAVCLFSEDTPLDLIKLIMPNVLVKGSDYSIEKIVGYTEIVNAGGLVTTIPFLEGYSTSSIERKIKNDQH